MSSPRSHFRSHCNAGSETTREFDWAVVCLLPFTATYAYIDRQILLFFQSIKVNLQILDTSTLGLGLSPIVVGVTTDYIFADAMRLGKAVTIRTVVLCSLGALFLPVARIQK